MSVTLRKRKNADGTISLRLDIYHNGKRVIETLKNLQLSNPTTATIRDTNKELLAQAKAIAVARAVELESNNYNVTNNLNKKIRVTTWMQSYVDTYTKKDKRNVQGALNRFKDFLLHEKKSDITFSNLDALLIEKFIDYLESRSKGEGAPSYYHRFAKMLRYAYRKGIMKVNVLDFVEKKVKGKAAKKDILTLDEVRTLISKPIESNEIRKAAIFSLMTGLAWIDVKNLKWRNIDYRNKTLHNAYRSKTEEPIIVPLNDAAIKVLDNPGKEDGFIFNLPSANGANKTLKAWVKRAAINKKITWHNLRHSAGTNLAYSGVDILTISKILSHSTTKHTMRYVNAANEMKIKAMENLNIEL
jgi:integrase